MSLKEPRFYVITKKEIKTVVSKVKTKNKSLSSESTFSFYLFICLFIYLFIHFSWRVLYITTTCIHEQHFSVTKFYKVTKLNVFEQTMDTEVFETYSLNSNPHDCAVFILLLRNFKHMSRHMSTGASIKYVCV